MRVPGAGLAMITGILFAGLVSGHAADKPCCGPITSDGQNLADLLDQSDVENLWQPAQHVNWETGQADPSRPGGTSRSTHCSAFAAAIAERAGVYLLRPPDHGQGMLANAQAAWLESNAAKQDGWKPLATPEDAQAAANRGELVLAIYRNPDPQKPGHVAVIRPSEKTEAQLERDGPQEAQAGAHNWLSTSVADGFRGHRGAWQPGGGGALRYYAHDIFWAGS